MKQPTIGSTVEVRLRANNGRLEKASATITNVITVYSGGNKVKTTSGDVWRVKPSRGKANFEAIR